MRSLEHPSESISIATARVRVELELGKEVVEELRLQLPATNLHAADIRVEPATVKVHGAAEAFVGVEAEIVATEVAEADVAAAGATSRARRVLMGLLTPNPRHQQLRARSLRIADYMTVSMTVPKSILSGRKLDLGESSA